ncbi:hypothetical protein SAMN05421823_105273 [Catalinimonas alkaloidigena]|uniref:Type IX secretion system membrane protein, PorP/SprF family n=1 Tax=Catalinimonas alkaloidigena TaxID=1075417 RepID=A0A1G9JCE9_9BACT|nr:hypothetical protein [Catalinimonas alkaloidigena]SDL35108.1 hypothetical protein SAMN05421823_105273 [Catalinimonas alkaloidigena]
MKRLLSLFTTFILIFPALAGNDAPVSGGQAQGMGGTGVTLRDTWSLFNNVGGLAGLDKPSVGLFFERRFATNAFNVGALAVAFPGQRWGAAGLSFRRFGTDLYNEQRLGLAYGHKLGEVTLGAQAEYLQTAIAEVGTRHAFVLNLGGVASILPHLHFGAYIFNVTQTRLADYLDERVPTVMKAGLSYRPTDALMINLETEKDLDYPALVRAGVEYRIIPEVALRTGISTDPSVFYFGAGFTRHQFALDYALSTHPSLGLSHHLSLQYRFDVRKKKPTPAS